jgi:uncharacterized Tic20 family protein
MNELTGSGMSSDERMWGMLCHLSALTGYFSGLGFVLGPLIVWLLKKDQYSFVDEQGKDAPNFQITMCIAAIVSALLVLLLIDFVLLWMLAIVNLVLIIIAVINANNGVHYEYPFALRLISLAMHSQKIVVDAADLNRFNGVMSYHTANISISPNSGWWWLVSQGRVLA